MSHHCAGSMQPPARVSLLLILPLLVRKSTTSTAIRVWLQSAMRFVEFWAETLRGILSINGTVSATGEDEVTHPVLALRWALAIAHKKNGSSGGTRTCL